MTYKGFDTRVGSRFDASLVAELNRLMARAAAAVEPSAAVVQIIGKSGPVDSAAALGHARPGAIGSVRHPRVVTRSSAVSAVPMTAKMREVGQQPGVMRVLSFSVPAARPGNRRIDLAITPARQLASRYFAGGRNWHETQPTEE